MGIRLISLTDKFILLFIAMGVIAAGLVSSTTYFLARDALMSRTFDQLTSVKSVKKRQIENFFNERKNEVNLLIQLIQNRNSTISDKFLPDIEFLQYFVQKNISYSNYYCITENSFHTNSKNLTSNTKNVLQSYFDSDKIILRDIAGELNKEKFFVVIGAPIKINGKKSGFLLLDINLDVINKIMYESNPATGLGESGESYLVGKDLLMRSESRFQKNTVMNVEVDTEGVRSALLNKSETDVILDYRGIDVLSSYCKLDIQGLDWVLLAEIDLEEAIAPINRIRNFTLLLTISISLLVFITAYIISKRISKPLIRLRDASKLIGAGDFNIHLETDSRDEIGELTKAFNIMSKKLFEKNEELRVERLIRNSVATDTQEKERDRLSRELHDGLGQTFIGIKLKLEQLKNKNNTDPEYLINDIDHSLNDAIDEIRRMSNDLMPSVLKEFGIERAIKILCEKTNEYQKTKIEFTSELTENISNDKSKIYIYRIVQEAINNILKHSEANQARISFFEKHDDVMIEIKDTGIGKDLNKKSASSGAGLYNIKDRVEILEGNVEFISSVNNGFLVKISIPRRNIFDNRSEIEND
jgi:two-component system NarL family sensor kinase